jgi:hypothetical protein
VGDRQRGAGEDRAVGCGGHHLDGVGPRHLGRVEHLPERHHGADRALVEGRDDPARQRRLVLERRAEADEHERQRSCAARGEDVGRRRLPRP